MLTHEHLVNDAAGNPVAVVLPVAEFEALRQAHARQMHAVRALREAGFSIAAVGSILGLDRGVVHECLESTGGDPLELGADEVASDAVTLERLGA